MTRKLLLFTLLILFVFTMTSCKKEDPYAGPYGKRIVEDLIEAKNRGVDVKIIIDESSVKGKYVDIDFIKQNGINIKIENWLGKMHMKSMIIDDENLVIGSMNFTKQGERMNDENCLIIKNSPKLAKEYRKHFLELWYSIK